MSEPPPSRRSVAVRAAGVVLARARFLILVGGFLAILAAWPLARNYWDKWTRRGATGGAVSGDTEYWCPMCPGVVSSWPSKCPVCNMALVRREKGDMTPLPDGVVARVQLSPYRVQLAGVLTSPVQFRRLEHDVTVTGKLEAASPSGLVLVGEVFERDARALAAATDARVTSDGAPGESAAGRIAEVIPGTASTAWRVRVRVENPRGDLRPGEFASAKFVIPLSHLPTEQRAEHLSWRDRAAVESAFQSGGLFFAPLPSLLDSATRTAAARGGLVACVPESAVIDTGTKQVVFVETMKGTFDAIEVRLGRRCGDHFPVRSGVEIGQRVVVAGATLLDAETRLNPSLAASYFGATARQSSPPPAAPPSSAGPSDDAALVAKQKICPVTDEPLDSMGGPVRLVVDGRVVFICCKGCEKSLRKNPAQFLSKIPK